MKRALIGFSGFVGSNLDIDQDHFSHRYNSKNIQDMRGQAFDEVICAGVQAVKWWANQNPEEDWQMIQSLLDVLATIKADRFILISTVDVYRSPVAVNENTKIETEGLHPYGAHRWRVEEWVHEKFNDPMVVRLPGLFGTGLKKNLIYDLLNGKDVGGFDARSTFQFYDLSRLRLDLEIARENDLGVVNFATEPVSVAAVAELLTGKNYDNVTQADPMIYDMQSIHADVWGKPGKYLISANEIISAIAAFEKRVDQ